MANYTSTRADGATLDADVDKGVTAYNFTQNIRKSVLDNPLVHILKKNKLVDTLAPDNLTSDLTWTRASTATYVDQYGVVKTAAIDEPRQEKDGWLIEGESTNESLYARDCTNGAWVKTNITAALDATGRDGNANSASALTATAANGTCFQTITLASSDYTYSVDVRRKTGSGTIEITIDGGATYTDITSSLSTSDYVRFEITQTLANPSIGFRIVTSGDEIEVDYNQCEDLPFASSRMPTTTAAVTRSADNVSCIVSNNLSDGLDDISITLNVQSSYKSGFHNFVSVDLSVIDTLRITHTSSSSIAFKHGTSSSTAINDYNESMTALGLTYVRQSNLLTAYQDGNEKAQLDAGTQSSAVATNTIDIGSRQLNNSRYMYGYISDLRIYDAALNSDEIQFLGQ